MSYTKVIYKSLVNSKTTGLEITKAIARRLTQDQPYANKDSRNILKDIYPQSDTRQR